MKDLAMPAIILALAVLQTRRGAPADPPAPDELTVVAVPPSASPNRHYPSNRPPLAVSPLVKLPVGAVEPRGWLMAQLQLMRDGFTGRLVELREIALRPRELATVHDDAPDARAVPAHELRQRVDDDVGPEIDRAAKVRRGKGVVDDKGNIVLVGDPSHRFDVQHVAPRVADRLAVQALRLRRDRLAEVLGIVRFDERRVEAEFPEADIELRVGAAVERARRHHLVAGHHQAADGDELGRLPARHRQRRGSVLERRHPLFQYPVGGVHDAGVNVAELLKREQVGRVRRILENVRSRLIDRHRPGPCRRVRLVAGM